MYHYVEIDTYLIREHNQQIFREVQALRLEKRLRKNHKVRGSRLAAFAHRLRDMLQLLGRVGLAGR